MANQVIYGSPENNVLKRFRMCSVLWNWYCRVRITLLDSEKPKMYTCSFFECYVFLQTITSKVDFSTLQVEL